MRVSEINPDPDTWCLFFPERVDKDQSHLFPSFGTGEPSPCSPQFEIARTNFFPLAKIQHEQKGHR